jgi:hypothetical protein
MQHIHVIHCVEENMKKYTLIFAQYCIHTNKRFYTKEWKRKTKPWEVFIAFFLKNGMVHSKVDCLYTASYINYYTKPHKCNEFQFSVCNWELQMKFWSNIKGCSSTQLGSRYKGVFYMVVKTCIVLECLPLWAWWAVEEQPSVFPSDLPYTTSWCTTMWTHCSPSYCRQCSTWAVWHYSMQRSILFFSVALYSPSPKNECSVIDRLLLLSKLLQRIL